MKKIFKKRSTFAIDYHHKIDIFLNKKMLNLFKKFVFIIISYFYSKINSIILQILVERQL